MQTRAVISHTLPRQHEPDQHATQTLSCLPVMLVLLLLLHLSGFLSAEALAAEKSAPAAVIITTATGQTRTFQVEIADSPRLQQKGLSFRKTLPADQGMIFLYQDAAERRFWMRNTLVSLDIIFINAAGRISKIHPRAVPRNDDFIASDGPARAVLEINAGLCEELDIHPGDRVQLNGNELYRAPGTALPLLTP